MLFLFVCLIVAVVIMVYVNKKFADLNKKILVLQDELQRVSEQVAINQQAPNNAALDKTTLDKTVLTEDVKNALDKIVFNETDTAFTNTAPIDVSSHSVNQTPDNSGHLVTDNFIQPTSGNSGHSPSDDKTLADKPLNKKSIKDRLTGRRLSSHKPSEPDEQSTAIVTSVLQSLRNWFFGGNLVVRVGAIILLMGVVLLLRLLSAYVEVSIEVKLIAIGAIGLGLAGLGLKLVKNRFTYGMTLQGAGLAITYLTAFFAYQVYDALSSFPSFVLLGSLSAVTVILAVRQNAFPLALLAFSGAFLAPILTHTETGSLTTLFSYYLLLNVAIAVIAHYRTWKVLNLLAATVTFGFAYYLGLVDTVNSANDFDSQRWSLVTLVTLHWLLYVFVVIRYAQQLLKYNEHLAHDALSRDSVNKLKTDAQPVPDNSRLFDTLRTYKDSNTAFIIPIDVSLMFGVPLLAFGLLSTLLSDIDNALTIASALMSATYLGLGSFFVIKDKRNRNQNHYTPLIEGMMALGFGFFALMIAIAFDAQWAACGWSIQGLALVWFGRHSLRAWTVLLGILLQFFGVASLLSLFNNTFGYSDPVPISNLSLSISAICSMASLFILRYENSPTQPSRVNSSKEQQLLASMNVKNPVFKMIWSNPILISLLCFIGMFWGLVVTGIIINDYFDSVFSNFVELTAFTLLLNAILYLVIDRYREWSDVRALNHALISLFYLCFASTIFVNFEFYTDSTRLNWPIFIISALGWLVIGQLWLKRWQETQQSTIYDPIVWLMTGILLIAQLSYYLLPDSDGVITVLITGTSLISLTYLGLKQKLKTPSWFDWQTALLGCALLCVPVSVVWAIYSNWTFEGIVWGLPYLPLLNLYDLSLLTILAYLVGTDYLSSGRKYKLIEDNNLLLKVAGLLGFWILSSLLIRGLHTYVGTPLWSQGAWFNEQVQTALTIFWTLTALVATIISSRYHKRFWWFMGIGLLGIVVLKLVLVDLSQTDAIWRVVSFLGAGSLILLIGYLAPLPPEHNEKKRAEPLN